MAKREDYLSWEDYFMGLARLSADRSKDPVTQVGACIVDEKQRVIGLGYNGFARGCKDNEFPWGKDEDNPLNDKRTYVVHAEANAILNKIFADISGSQMYTTLFPCNDCAKLIIQAGIKEVVYWKDDKKDKPEYEASKRMFDAAKVIYRQFVPEKTQIHLDY